MKRTTMNSGKNDDRISHNRLQQECWQHLWNVYPQSRYACWHTKNEDIPYPNETKQSYIIRRSRDKAVGLLPGVWDLVLYWKGVLYLFDIKMGKDTLSDAQIRFRDKVLENGGQACVIEDLHTFELVTKVIFHGH